MLTYDQRGLPADTVHVWWAERSDAQERWRRLLDPSELQRLGTYRRDEDRDRFLVACAVVRTALGTYLDLSPASVPLVRACPDCARAHGRITLAGSWSEDQPQVSVSHSGRWVAVAVHRGGPVGVDVQEIGLELDVIGLGRRVLAASELARLASLPEPERASAFIRYWCRKEAVTKLTGDGLRADLSHVVVSAPDEPAALVTWAERPELPARLYLRDLVADPDHEACLAVDSTSPVRVEERAAIDLLWGG